MEQSMQTDKAYGGLMSYLLTFRKDFATDDEFNRFVMESVRSFVYDLRDVQVYITIYPSFMKQRGKEVPV